MATKLIGVKTIVNPLGLQADKNPWTRKSEAAGTGHRCPPRRCKRGRLMGNGLKMVKKREGLRDRQRRRNRGGRLFFSPAPSTSKVRTRLTSIVNKSTIRPLLSVRYGARRARPRKVEPIRKRDGYRWPYDENGEDTKSLRLDFWDNAVIATGFAFSRRTQMFSASIWSQPKRCCSKSYTYILQISYTDNFYKIL